MTISTKFLQGAGQRMERLTPEERDYVSKVLRCADSVEERAKVLYAAGFPKDAVVLNDWCDRVAGPPKIGAPGSVLGGLVTRWGGMDSVGSAMREIKRLKREDPELGKEFRDVNVKYASRPEIQTTGQYVLNLQKAISNVEKAQKALERAGDTSHAGCLEGWLHSVRGYHTTREYTDGTITSIYVPDPYIHYDVQYTPGLVEKIGVGSGKLSVEEAREKLRFVTDRSFAQAMKAARQLPAKP